MNKKQYYITLFTIAFVILFAIIFGWWQRDNSQLSARCTFNQIELINLTPHNCWNKDFSSEYCPIPKDIDCSVDIKGLADFILAIQKIVALKVNQKEGLPTIDKSGYQSLTIL